MTTPTTMAELLAACEALGPTGVPTNRALSVTGEPYHSIERILVGPEPEPKEIAMFWAELSGYLSRPGVTYWRQEPLVSPPSGKRKTLSCRVLRSSELPDLKLDLARPS